MTSEPTSGAGGPGVVAEVVYAEVDRALGVGDRRDHHCSESPLAVEDCRGADGDALTADPVGGREADLEADRGAAEGQGDVGVDLLDAVAAPVGDHARGVGDARGGDEGRGR